MARIGARTAAHAVAPPAAVVHAPRHPAASARPVPAPVALPRRGGTIAPPVVRAEAPADACAIVRRATARPSAVARRAAAVGPAPAIHGAPLLTAAVATARGPVRPAVRRVAAASVALRTQRRERVAWRRLPRRRLAAAWAAVQRDHAGGGGELSLVGVYGPLPLDGVEAATLAPDGRLTVTLARGARGAVPGDVVLARSDPGHVLLRCDVPYPARGRPVRRTR